MIEKEGAGSWPPRSDFDRWPAVFVPYQEIYQQLLPLLSTTEPSLDDEVNIARCQNYRSLMRKLLAEKINLDEVERFLTDVEFGKHTSFSREAYNGFYACVSVSRHAYRWATVPVVKVAQMEKFVDFPRELVVPWAYLKRYYGVIADGGNNTANILHTFNVHGERVLKINVGVPAAIMTAEEIFFRIFYDVELMNLHDTRMPRSIWLRYVQGFQAWGIGELIDGRFVKYDGLSGNNALAFQALDAFLGMPLYLKDEDMTRYIPVRQRNLVYTLQKYCFRGRIEGKDGERVAELFKMIAKQLKVCRFRCQMDNAAKLS
ncbi:uncharacterized protein N7459_006568 [Penicillium hispanicum]|uniref:uncharacterized protein n=1 Tax=Penicillium hispanicum TaxID=1080232 RepID=UPI0025419562|nr:uncharacterized protein N7459_006568 [Penicillium hispanicum]KAJ5577604.1 hypothetical protein N7459_006568 [Penicillium hispanicum]